MFCPWIKRLSAVGLLVLGGSQASAQYGLGTPHRTNHASQYVPGTPRSPGAGSAVFNSTGRYFGFGYSEGYHQCPDGSCNTCSQTGWLHGHNVLGRMGGHGVPNIAAPGAPACNSCQSPVPNTNCGPSTHCSSPHFGHYQFHAGHVFGRPSYGNPHYPTDCINWREAVKYDQGPCVPPAYYQGPAVFPAPGLTYSQPSPEMVPQYMPQLPNMQLPNMQLPNMQAPQMQQHISLPEPSPSDTAPGAWPWQRGNASVPQSAPVAPAAPRGLDEPTPAVPLTPVPPPPAPQPPEPNALIPKALVPAAPALESLPPPVDDDGDLLGEDDSEPKLQLPGQADKPAPAPSAPIPAPTVPAPTIPAPTVPAPPVPTPAPVAPAPAPPAPAVEPTPADEDEDLLSSRRNPIRQPKRR